MTFKLRARHQKPLPTSTLLENGHNFIRIFTICSPMLFKTDYSALVGSLHFKFEFGKILLRLSLGIAMPFTTSLIFFYFLKFSILEIIRMFVCVNMEIILGLFSNTTILYYVFIQSITCNMSKTI